MTNTQFKENYACPKLQHKNHQAALLICRDLKSEKCLSNEQFITRLIKYRRDSQWNRLPQNFTNIISFLRWHNMVTPENVNGLVIWVATQKCFRAKEENWFLVKQKVSLYQLEKALDYQKINDGKVASGIEGTIIAENIFRLTGPTKMEFISSYINIMEKCKVNNCPEDYDRAIINSVNDIKTIAGPYKQQ